MKILSVVTVLAIAAFALSCAEPANTNLAANKSARAKGTATPVVHKDDGHDAPRISLADAKKAFDDKTALFIDTHSKEQFDAEHIVGAINIQANTIKQNMDKVPRGKTIIAYCS